VSDQNRHWRESIGVLPDQRFGRTRTSYSQGAAARKRPESPTPQVHPGDLQPDGADPLFAAEEKDFGSLEALIDNLPSGTQDFAARVGDELWPHPSGEELQALTRIIENRHLIPRGPARVAALRSIVLRRRVEQTREGSRSITADRDVLDARCQQWDRLADAATEILDALKTDGAADPSAPVIDAVHALVPSPSVLKGEAAVTRGVSALIDGERNAGPRLAALIPEALEVIEGFRQSHLPPSHAPLVEVAAGFLVIDEDLRAGDTQVLTRDRKLVERLLATLDRSIEELMPQHARAPEKNAWLAAWRRRALDLRVRLDEHLTRPGSQPATEAPAAQEPEPKQRSQDEEVVDRLRQLRAKSEEKEEEEEAEPRRSESGVLGWLRRIGGR
jgi:hypothetical protein